MIIHQNQLLSEDILEKQFVCDLNACKGACCVEGDAGAPVLADEKLLVEAELNKILPFLSKESQEYIQHNGGFSLDEENEWVTNCLPDGTCVFAVKDNAQKLHCGIERAWKNGDTSFQKPISCHLYPIRILKLGEFDALNYHKWEICNAACSLGEKLKIPVYKFLKEALVRRFGKEWYDELEEIAIAYSHEKGQD